MSLCVFTNQRQEAREFGAKPVHTPGLRNGGNRFKLDVAESFCERPGPCESTPNVFSGHLVFLETV